LLIFFTLFHPGNSLKYMIGATLQSLAKIGRAPLVSVILTRWIAKTNTLSPATKRNCPELQKRLNGWISASLMAARLLSGCVACML
ncbi:mechanosensitive channel protein, partial [Klebsiella pneumoniae]|nr:mechanosensitive channel protein [Klebsiella pneumoniae]